jgi:hypothetical protein
MSVRRLSKLTGLMVLAVIVLAGCRAEEQGRLTNYEPGVYKGKPDTQLSEVQRRQLRKRSVRQGTSFTSGGGGGSAAKSQGTRAPQKSSIDLGKLRSRARMQSGSGARL